MAELISKGAILILLGDKPVAYHPVLAKKLGGVEVAVFVSQLLYWTGRGKLPDGWIFKRQADFGEETGLTRRNQETARKKLKELGILQEELRGVPATLHYRLDLDKLAEILSSETIHNTDTQQSSLAESAKLDCTDPPNWIVPIRQTIPENTTEITFNKDSASAPPLSEKQKGPESPKPPGPKRVLMDAFTEIAGIPEPARKPDLGFWWSAIGEICTLAGQSPERGRQLIAAAVKRLRADDLTISGPNSLIKTIRAIIGEESAGKNGGQGPGFNVERYEQLRQEELKEKGLI